MSAESATASSGGSNRDSAHDQTIVEQPEASSAGAKSARSLAEEMEGAVGGFLLSRESTRTASSARTSSLRSSSVGARSSSSRQELITDLHAQLQANIQEQNEIEQSRLQAAYAPPETTSRAQSHVAVSSSHLQQLNAATTVAHASLHLLTSTQDAATPSVRSPCVKPTGTIPKVFTNRAAPQPFVQVQSFAPSMEFMHSSHTPAPQQTQHAHPSTHGIFAARPTASLCSQYTMRTSPALSHMHADISSSSKQQSTRMAPQTTTVTKPPPPGGPLTHHGPPEAARAILVAQQQYPGHQALSAAQVPLSSRSTSVAGPGVQPATSFAQTPSQHVASALHAHADAIAPSISAAGFAPTIGAFGAQVSNTFGAPSSSAFGAPPTNAFVAHSYSSFGTQPSGAFGGPSLSAFSAPPLGAFGSYTPSPGVPSSSAFGAFGAAHSNYLGAVGSQAFGAYGEPNPRAMGYGEMVFQPRRRLYELPSFSGRPEEWPMFVNTYVNSTAAYGYTQLENLERLQKSVVGEAKRTIQCLLIHPQHVDAAMMRLQSLYGRPERLVRSQIQLTRDLPAVTEERIVELVPFATAVQNVAMFLDTPATQFYLADPILLEELVRKLPMGRRISWAADAARLGRQATVMDFANWVTAIADLIGIVAYDANCSQQSRSGGSGGKKQHVLLNIISNTSTKACSFCFGEHNIARCAEFLKLAIKDRRRVVFGRALCICCFEASHILPACNKRKPCGKGGCTSGHHRLLHVRAPRLNSQPTADQNNRRSANFDGCQRQHREQCWRRDRVAQTTNAAPTVGRTPHSLSTKMPIDNEVESTVDHCCEATRKSVLLYRVVPVTVSGPKGKVTTFALLDEGSAITLVDAGLADELGLQGPSSKLSLDWFSDHTSVTQSRCVTLEIAGLQDGGARYRLQNARTIDKLNLPSQTLDGQSLLETFPHLTSVPFLDYADAKPRVLIGLDHHHLGVPLEIRVDAERRGIVASKTPLRSMQVLTIQHAADSDEPCGQQLTARPSCWRSVTASIIVAEEARRMQQPVTFRTDSRWKRGPALLRFCEEERSTNSSTVDDCTRARRYVMFRPNVRWTRGPARLRPSEKESPASSPAGVQLDVSFDDDIEVRRNFVGAGCLLYAAEHVRRRTEKPRTNRAGDLAHPPDLGDIGTTQMLRS